VLAQTTASSNAEGSESVGVQFVEFLPSFRVKFERFRIYFGIVVNVAPSWHNQISKNNKNITLPG